MVYIFIVIVLFLLEFWIKNYIEKNKKLNDEEEIIKDKLAIRYIQNKGAIYSSFEDKSTIVCGISCLLIIVMWIIYIPMVLKKGNQGNKFGLTFMIAGGMSNVYDRVKRKYVVDYIHWNKLKKIIFNLADVFILIGGLIVVITNLIDNHSE